MGRKNFVIREGKSCSLLDNFTQGKKGYWEDLAFLTQFYSKTSHKVNHNHTFEPLLSGHPWGNERWPLNRGLFTWNIFTITLISW